jgi:cell division transport system permease protein
MAAAQRRNISRRVRFSYATSTVSMTLVLFLLGTIAFIMANIFTTTKRMRESVTMIVELKDNLSEAERDTVAVRLAESEMVASLKFVSKEEKAADEEFQRAFNIDIKGVLGDNPLPDSYDVTLSALSSDKEQLEKFAEEARKIKGVDFVSYPQSLIENMHSALDTMQLIMLIFGGALLVVSFVLLNNTVRLAVYSQRELINTLKVVGATKWFIVRPFVGRSALQGLLAGVIAALLLGASLYALNTTIPGIGILPKWEVLGIFAAAMVTMGIVVAVVCTLPVVNRFVNMKSNKIYLC